MNIIRLAIHQGDAILPSVTPPPHMGQVLYSPNVPQYNKAYLGSHEALLMLPSHHHGLPEGKDMYM